MQRYKRNITFIHTADLHLGSPFTGLTQKDRHIADQLNKALYQSFDNIISLCLEKKVDFILIAGDAFDSGERNLRSILHFVQGMRILSNHKIPVIIVTGNHDPLQGRSGPTSIWDTISQYIGSEPLFILIRSDKKEIIDIFDENDLIAKICGVSFSKSDVNTNPVRFFNKREDESIPHIGLVHGNIGSHSEHIPYAPCTVTDLLPFQYDYWAFGHVHAKSEEHESDPVVQYPGNIQGRTWNETGPKGCLHVTIETDGTITTIFCDTAPIRFETKDLDISEMEQEDELSRAISQTLTDISTSSGSHSTILSLTLTGSGPLHSILLNTELRNDLLGLFQESAISSPFCYLSKIIDRTKPIFDRELFRGRGDLFEEIIIVREELSSEIGLQQSREMLNSLFGHHSLSKILNSLSDDEIQDILKNTEELILEELGALDED